MDSFYDRLNQNLRYVFQVSDDQWYCLGLDSDSNSRVQQLVHCCRWLLVWQQLTCFSSFGGERHSREFVFVGVIAQVLSSSTYPYVWTSLIALLICCNGHPCLAL